MFVFDNVLDKDVSSYEYQLYKADQVTGSFPNYSLINNATIYLSGESGSNVFAISVENSSDAQNIRYYGRVRTKDTSNNYSSFSPLVLSDQDTPLIGSQFISSLTAAKITAGKIGAHEIILSQAGPQTNIAAPSNMAILRSSDYNGSYSSNTWTNGSSGWIIAGDGHAEFSSASLRGGLKAQSVYIDAHNRWRRNSSDTDNSLEFKVGSNDKYVFFDGTDITFSGNLSAAGGTFSGNLSAAGGTFTGALSGGTISIGSGNSIFKADSNGIYLGNSTFASAPFRVTPAGVLTANNATITGTINATSGTFSGNLSGAGGTFSGNLSAAGGTFTGALSGGTISIGSGNSIFKADSSGIYLGNATFASAPFRVTPGGVLTATNANVSGTINATIGSIGGWTINSDNIGFSSADGDTIIKPISDYLTPFVYGGSIFARTELYWGMIEVSSNGAGGTTVTQITPASIVLDAITSRISLVAGNIDATGVISASSFFGNLNGTASTASNANALAGYPASFSENANTVPIRQSDASVRAGYLVMTGGHGIAAGSEVRKRNDGYLLTFTSRRELKNNIENLDSDFALSIVNSLQPVSFRMNETQYIGDLFSQREATYKEYGFIAQDVAEIDANLATYSLNAEGDAIQPQAWSSHALISLSVSAIKGLIKEIEDLKNRILTLES